MSRLSAHVVMQPFDHPIQLFREQLDIDVVDGQTQLSLSSHSVKRAVYPQELLELVAAWGSSSSWAGGTTGTSISPWGDDRRHLPADHPAAQGLAQARVMTMSTLHGLWYSIRLTDTEVPRHQRSAQLSRCLWPSTIRSACGGRRANVSSTTLPTTTRPWASARRCAAAAGRRRGPTGRCSFSSVSAVGLSAHRRRPWRWAAPSPFSCQMKPRLAPLADLLAVRQRPLRQAEPSWKPARGFGHGTLLGSLRRRVSRAPS